MHLVNKCYLVHENKDNDTCNDDDICDYDYVEKNNKESGGEYMEVCTFENLNKTPPLGPDNLNPSLDDTIDSLCAEEVGGEAVLEKDIETEVDDDTNNSNGGVEENARKGRGRNKEYVKIEQFESKEEFDKYWSDNNYDKEYNFHITIIHAIGVNYIIHSVIAIMYL